MSQENNTIHCSGCCEPLPTCSKLDFLDVLFSSKALSSYRQIRRKYREQVWRLEQKVAATMESQYNQSGATKTAEEALEWKREETVL